MERKRAALLAAAEQRRAQGFLSGPTHRINVATYINNKRLYLPRSGATPSLDDFSRLLQAAPSFSANLEAKRDDQGNAQLVKRDGRDYYETRGYASTFEQRYDMYDTFGPYEEIVSKGAADESLAANPDVPFLLNHTGVTMARTTNGTLELRADAGGLHHIAWHNPERADVQLMMSAIHDRLINEMSFGFMITEGWWSDDFLTFRIASFDINRGDVSAVNLGANPYTNIGARATNIMKEALNLPASAKRELALQLDEDGYTVAQQRELIVVSERDQGLRSSFPSLFTLSRSIEGKDSSLVEPVKASKSVHMRRLEHRVARTTERFIAHAARTGATVADLPSMKLPWYEIRSVRSADSTTVDEGPAEVPTIFIFDEIGGSFGIDSKQFALDLEQIDAPNIAVRINSPGGSLFDALAIYNALNHHPAHVTVYIDALAASAASLIAMAGDEIVMMPGSEMMIHDAAAVEDGNAADMAKMSTFLDRQSDNMADIYRMRGGGEAADWRQLMLAETWMFAGEAVAMGLADRAEEGKPAVGDLPEVMSRSFDLSCYRYAGRAASPVPGQVADREKRESDATVETPADDNRLSVAAVQAELAHEPDEPTGGSVAGWMIKMNVADMMNDAND